MRNISGIRLTDKYSGVVTQKDTSRQYTWELRLKKSGSKVFTLISRIYPRFGLRRHKVTQMGQLPCQFTSFRRVRHFL